MAPNTTSHRFMVFSSVMVSPFDGTAVKEKEPNVLDTSGPGSVFGWYPLLVPYVSGRPATSASTTAGSARVVMSPIAPASFSAILRRIRRMILPERVLGSPGAN